MIVDEQDLAIAEVIVTDVGRSSSGSKRMKLRSLLRRFGYLKRSDKNTAAITTLLEQAGAAISPAIVRLGEAWELDYEDWVYISLAQAEAIRPVQSVGGPQPPAHWAADGWFERIQRLELRSEREVETKFIIPLLHRLGYSEDDRFDGMPVPASIGSKSARLVADFVLFDAASEALKNQPLLIVEAKKKSAEPKTKDLAQAREQARSYALFARCELYMITNGRTIQLHHVRHWRGNEPPVFACEARELVHRFGELFTHVGKERLTAYYLAKQRTTEEVRD